MLLEKKIHVIIILGSIFGIATAGYVGFQLINANIDPSDRPFNERWIFDVSLDRTEYSPGDNITVTLELTCLMDYTVSEYYWIKPWTHVSWRILDSNSNTAWSPSGQHGAISFVNYEFHAGDDFSGTPVLHLGTTEEKPDDWSNFHHWIPLLAPGGYYFVVSLNRYMKFKSDDVSSISIPFRINNPVI